MSIISGFVTGYVLGSAGLAVGIVTTNWCWRREIRNKAASGFRLEVSGVLYQVMTADEYDADQTVLREMASGRC